MDETRNEPSPLLDDFAPAEPLGDEGRGPRRARTAFERDEPQPAEVRRMLPAIPLRRGGDYDCARCSMSAQKLANV